MRDIFFALLVGFGVLAIGLWLSIALITHEPHHQLRNPYYPFTVETAIHDK